MRQLFLSILLTTSLQAKALIAHEWGTFTSFQDSQGHSLLGLHRGDQALPDFVYLRDPLSPEQQSRSTFGCFVTTYSCDYRPDVGLPISTAANLINQRMETPVIYFYSDNELSAEVKVEFPKGIITEWYPRASEFSPPINEVRGIENGSMTWKVDISTQTLDVPTVSEESIWNPSRQVDANYIQVGEEAERLIFYRGVGRFETPFRAIRNTNSFSLLNLRYETSANLIPSVIYVRVQNGKGYVETLGPLSTIREFIVPESSKDLAMDQYLDLAFTQLVRQLVASGLYEKEAAAMANTWRQAYFLTPGERFLYVLPRTWTDELLPIQITPQPAELNRVLVGRVEVMNSSRFNEAYNLIKQLALSQTPPQIINLDFSGFEEQVLRMAQDTADETESDSLARLLITTFCKDLIAQLYN